MKSIVCAVVLTVVLAFFAPSVALSGDYITDATDALRQSPVYVYPGTEGTDNDTAAKLRSRLTRDDNIVLVMLPAAAEAELKMDATTIAQRLSERLENQRTIGLAVGRKLAAYGPTLPAGVAADQMRRAESVSNDSLTALVTFTQNMHLWLRDNPQPKPSPFPLPQKVPQKSEDFNWAVCLALLVILIGVCAVYILYVPGNGRNSASTERTRFKAPNQVKDLLTQIAMARAQIRDEELSATLYQLCLDIEKYFRWSTKEKEGDSLFFTDRLNELAQVIVKYIEVQEEPRYFHFPEDNLKRGKAAINDFSQYVLESIRRGREAALMDFRVNTDILKAQRYR